MNKTERIRDEQLTRYAKKLEKANLKRYGRSLTFVGISRAANSYILDICEGILTMKEGWREAMKKKALEQ